jgi:hypothetical protein
MYVWWGLFLLGELQNCGIKPRGNCQQVNTICRAFCLILTKNIPFLFGPCIVLVDLSQGSMSSHHYFFMTVLADV